MVETIDIYPTTAELCGLTPLSSAAGSSLMPMWRNPFAPGKNHAFSIYNLMTTIRTPSWRLIDANGDKDLYNMSTFRYEVAGFSASNPSVVSTLSANLSTQGTRPGTTYTAWAAGNSQLTDPNGDADKDGNSNLLEYGSGTYPLDPASRPVGTLAAENLSGMGFSDRELVYRVMASTLPNEIIIVPSTSFDLSEWSFAPLRFFDASDIGGGRRLFRYRVTTPHDPGRFFRAGTLPQPSNP